jgi:hypothetical protein
MAGIKAGTMKPRVGIGKQQEKIHKSIKGMTAKEQRNAVAML